MHLDLDFYWVTLYTKKEKKSQYQSGLYKTLLVRLSTPSGNSVLLDSVEMKDSKDLDSKEEVDIQ